MIISQDNEKKLSQLAEDLKENVTIKDRKHHFVRSEWNSNHMNMNNMYNIGGNNERLMKNECWSNIINIIYHNCMTLQSI